MKKSQIEDKRLPDAAFALSRQEKATVMHGQTRVTMTKKKKKPNRRPRGDGYQPGKVNRITTMRTLMPDQVDVVLPWIYENQLTNAGLSFASLRFQSNGLWDPDPAVGGTSFLGLGAWSSLYSYYRPVRVSYELMVANKEAIPLNVYVYNSNVDPGAIVGTAGSEYALNPFGKKKMLAPVTGGQSTVTLRGDVPFAALLGTGRSLMDDDNFRGLTSSANPADLFWIGFNTDGLGALQTALGVAFSLTLKVHTILYDRVLLQ